MHQLVSRAAVVALFVFLFASLPISAGAQTQTYTDPVTGMEFVSIPGGSFVMGNNDDKRAAPEHQVNIAPFYMGVYEVTFDQFAKYTEEYPRGLPDDEGWGKGNRPVMNVNWDEAQAFVQWLSEKTGRNFRLPTEAEWEYAAYGGASTTFPWGNELGEGNANCADCGTQWDRTKTAPVGSFAPNGYGLYDMIGNVYEWCIDRRHDSYVGAPTDGSAWLANGRFNSRVNRGGSWYQPAHEVTITRRCWDDAAKRMSEYGFRVVMEP